MSTNEVIQRLVCAFLVFLVLVPRCAVPFWIQVLCLRGTWFDRLVTKLRIVIDWSLFTEIGPVYHDIRITATTSEGQQLWYLLRDQGIGPVYLRSRLTRLTLAFYYESYPILNGLLSRELFQYFRDKDQVLRRLDIDLVVFSSTVSNREFDQRIGAITRLGNVWTLGTASVNNNSKRLAIQECFTLCVIV